LANKRRHPRAKRTPSALTSTFTFLIAGGTAALALGPDDWMEWATMGATVLSRQAFRLIFAIVAGGMLIRLVWPFLKQSARETR
jgi:hypothetical protein